MKKFDKKAVFAAILGALSSVSSFAMEGKSESKNVQKKSPGRPIDNANLSIFTDGRLKILDKNDLSCENSIDQDKLEDIFKRISEMELDNFDDFHDKTDPSVLQLQDIKDSNMQRYEKYKQKKKKKSTNNKKTTNNKKPKPKYALYNRGKNDAWGKPYLNPVLGLDHTTRKNKLIQIFADSQKRSFLDGSVRYCIHQNYLGETDGFIEFTVQRDRAAYIHLLISDATKLGTGIAGEMVDFMKSKYDKMETVPHGTRAEGFWQHMGFEYGTWGKKMLQECTSL